MSFKKEVKIGGNTISVETGHIARQADGSVLVRCDGTVIITTATSAHESSPDLDFFPLSVDYRERSYAAGKFPGGYFKREGRPADKETLAARMIDRPIRPLFPDNFLCKTHIVNFVLSHDQKHEADLLGILGSSAALMISDIPFHGPISPVRIGRINNEFIVNPALEELDSSDLNLTVVSSEKAIVRVEGGSEEISENELLEALELAFNEAQPLNQLQRDLVKVCGKEKRAVEEPELNWVDMDGNTVDPDEMFESFRGGFRDALLKGEKSEVYSALAELKTQLREKFNLEDSHVKRAFKIKFSDFEREVVRQLIIEEKKRNDGRKYDEIRPITCDLNLLPCVHGSALFTRGQTQALATLTLGTTQDEQKIDDLEGENFKRFMLHYNFPPFSVGEAGFLRGPGRREVGHGALAERAIRPILPTSDEFPYTMRVVSDILESNGSSSMASVCGAALSMMEGGVPIKNPVAGIAMGLIEEGENYVVLSDITGLEDHIGDMDFKVAGSTKGITAIQMDIKMEGLKFDIIKIALEQARKGRLHILEIMEKSISTPRSDIKSYAPRIHKLQISTDKIGAVIGPGGKVIRALTAETGANIEIEDDGTVLISSTSKESMDAAIKRVEELTEEAEIGKDYTGTVTRIENYGAFIEIIPGIEGLLHISRMANYHIRDVRDEMNEGDEVLVRVLEIDDAGRVKLTRQELMHEGKVEGKKPPESDDRSQSRPHSDSSKSNYRGGGSRRNSGPRRDSQRGGRRDSRNRPRRDSNDRPRRDSNDRPRRDSNDRPRRDSNDRPRRDSNDRRSSGSDGSKKPRKPRY